MAGMKKSVESSLGVDPTSLALQEMQEELKGVVPLDSKYEKAKGIFPDTLNAKKEGDMYVLRSKGAVIGALPLESFTTLGDKGGYRNGIKFDRLPSPYNTYTYTAQWYKDQSGSEHLSLYVGFQLSDESVILDDDNAIYEYPAGSDPYSFRITYNTDEDDSFEGDPFIDMDIRETLYNSEVMKELRKDNGTVTLRKKIGDKNYALTFTNIRQDGENSPRTLGITIKPLGKKTRTTEEREALEANKFRNFTDVPAGMSLKRRIGNDMRMEVYDKAGGGAGGKSYFVEIKEGVGNIEINDTLFQISESGSSYSIEKVSNNIASIDTDVEEKSGIDTTWEVTSTIDDLKGGSVDMEDDTGKSVSLAISSSTRARLGSGGVVVIEESISSGVDGSNEARQYKILLRVGKGELRASIEATGLGTNADGEVVRIDDSGNETLAQMPEGVVQYNSKDIFTVGLDGNDLSIEGHRSKVSFPNNLTTEQESLVKDLEFSNIYGRLNAPSPLGLLDNPERYALRSANDFRGKQKGSVIDIKAVADSGGFELQEDGTYVTYYEEGGREIEVSLHEVAHQKTDGSRWYVEMNILEVPQVEEERPADWFNEEKWKGRAKWLGEGLADIIGGVGGTLKELAGGFINKAGERERPEGVSRAAIIAWLESQGIPIDPEDPDVYDTGKGYPILYVPESNIEMINTGFDRVLPQVQGANVVWSPFKHNRGEGEIHDGLDIFVEEGTPITMPEDGEIVRREVNHSGNYGHLVVTKNSYTSDDGTEMDAYLYYAHLPQEKSRDPLDGIVDETFNTRNGGEGVPISKGTVIGYVSDTGNAKGTGAHLHIEAIVVPKGTSFKEVSKKHVAMAKSQNPDDPRRDTERIHPIRLFPDVKRRGNIPNGGLDDIGLGALPEDMNTNESNYLEHINKERNLNLEPVKGQPFNQEKRDIIPALLPNAKELSKEFGVPVSIILAQAINESGWGTGNVLKNSNSLFNITAGGSWKGEKYTSGSYVYRKYNFLSQSMFDYVTFLALQDQKFKGAFGKPANKRPGILKKMGYMEATDGAEVLLRIMKDNNLTQYDLKGSSTTVEPNTPDTPELEEIKHGDPEKITITGETIVFDHERSDEGELLTRDIKQVIGKPKTFNASNTDLGETEFLDSASTVDTQMKLFKYVKFGIEKNAGFITYVLKDKDGKKVFTFGSADDFSGSASGTRFHYNEGTRRGVSPTVSEGTVTLNGKEYTFKYKFGVALTKAQFFLLVDE